MITLTFDTDHMSEARMAAFLDEVPIPGRATIFCTQRYACLEGTHHELAPHPYLGESSDWSRELSSMRQMLPHARSWRSHSCVYSHIVAEWVGKNGYECVSTQDRLYQKGNMPIRETFGVWQFPIYYMDNLDFSDQRFWGRAGRRPFEFGLIETALKEPGHYVFDFHPIHLLLNSPNFEFYAAAREGFKSEEGIASLAFSGYGVRNFYNDLIIAMRATGQISGSLCESVPTLTEGLHA